MRLAGACLALSAACAPPGPAPAFRHLVLISLDTTRADHLSCYGAREPRTPSIDALAEEGVLFEDVTSPAPSTLAAHSSLMTGSWPHTHGVVRNGFVLHEDNHTLAERLAERGFHTAAFLGSFALAARFGFDQGFACFDQDFDQELDPGSGVDHNQRSATRVTDAVLAHLDRLPGGAPLFLFAHYFDPHTPYDPPAAFDRWGDPEAERPPWSLDLHSNAVRGHQHAVLGRSLGIGGVIDEGLPQELVDARAARPTPADLRLAGLYAGEVAYVDNEIGRLLAGLAARGILQDALVVLTGDHGETFWEHGDYWSHGDWVYDSTQRVPLILRLPDRRGAGTRVQSPVSTIDLLPTLLELLGAPARGEPDVEGTSLVPALAGEAIDRGPIFANATKPGRRFEPPGKWGDLLKARCVRDGPWKYVHAPYRGDTEQLFHLGMDPGEQQDLLRAPLVAAEHQEQRRRLRALLDAWVRERPRHPSLFDEEFLEDTNQRLSEMGYAGR